MKYRMLKKAGICVVGFVTALSLTACSFSFSDQIKEKQDEVLQEVLNQTLDSLSEKIDNTDLKDDEQLKELVSAITDELQKDEQTQTQVGNFEEASLVRVVDGDTIVVEIKGEEYKVRLIGIDTPESVASKEYLEKTGKENTEEGKEASAYTKALLEGHEVLYLQKDTSETDKYDRLLRYVWFDVPKDETDLTEISTKMLNAVLVKNGIANVATYEPDTRYAKVFETLAEERD